jgi:hypothetical protein
VYLPAHGLQREWREKKRKLRGRREGGEGEEAGPRKRQSAVGSPC